MKISDESIEEFRRIYKGVYGEEITLRDATEMAHSSRSTNSCEGLYPARTLGILLRHNLRLKLLPKRLDIRENLLTVLVIE